MKKIYAVIMSLFVSASIFLYMPPQTAYAETPPVETLTGNTNIVVANESMSSNGLTLVIFPPDGWLHSYKCRLCVQIGSETYYSSYDHTDEYSIENKKTLWGYSVNFPEQDEGEKISYWFEVIDKELLTDSEKTYMTSQSQKTIEYSYSLDDAVETYYLSQTRLEMNAEYYLILGADSDKARVRGVVEIGENKYYSEYQNENMDGYKFIVDFPKQPVGTSVTFYVEDSRGDKASQETVEITDSDDPIEIDEFYDSQTKVLKGSTYSNIDVTVKFNGKTKKTKSDKKGNFKVTTGYLSPGTKVTVTTEDSVGNKETLNFTVPRSEASVVCINSTVTRKSTKVKIAADDVNKGEYFILKIGKKSYKLGVKKTSREFNGSIKISKPSTGQKVSLKLYSKSGTVIGKDSDSKVYYDSDARVGMTKSQVKKTVLGKPDEITTSTNGWELWVYYWNDYKSATYVYFNNGKVVDVNDVNI